MILCHLPRSGVSAQTWQTVLWDDFSDSTLNSDHWNATYPWGNYTNTAEYSDPGLAFVWGGRLILQFLNQPGGGRSYISGVVTTYEKVSFSPQGTWIEIKARVPKGAGLWPALWLLPVDRSWPPEIDILEVRGSDVNHGNLTYHWYDSAQPDDDGYSATSIAINDASQWHTYGLWWDSNNLIWQVDGVTVRSVSGGNIPRQPMYLVINLAAGYSTSWAGAPNSFTPSPANFEIEYVFGQTYR